MTILFVRFRFTVGINLDPTKPQIVTTERVRIYEFLNSTQYHFSSNNQVILWLHLKANAADWSLWNVLNITNIIFHVIVYLHVLVMPSPHQRDNVMQCWTMVFMMMNETRSSRSDSVSLLINTSVLVLQRQMEYLLEHNSSQSDLHFILRSSSDWSDTGHVT